jgi:hypothetical protein
MSDRPAFQFYPADWRNNAKLRRCSEGARGAWIDVMCLMHDSDEYGVLRWPLAEIARAAGVPLKLLRELAAKGVLKGADRGAKFYEYAPRHAGKVGTVVTLVEPGEGPCWYCSRFVRDEWVRHQRGASSRFSADNQPPPKGGIGVREGDGPSSASSTTPPPSLRSGEGRGREGARRSPLPDGFAISPHVAQWAAQHGFARLDEHLEHFVLTCRKGGYEYADWDAALMDAIRDDWAKLRAPASIKGRPDLWWTTAEGTTRMGASLNPPLRARPGESAKSFAERVKAAIDLQEANG